MKLSELIENYKRIAIFCDKTSTKSVILELQGLEKSQKPVVPQFVADWISYAKGWNKTLHYALENSPEKVNLWLCEDELNRQNVFARAWLDGYEVEETKYVVTDGNRLYFKNYQEDIEIVILVDEQPGTMEYVKKFDTKKEAQKAADILGWKVQEVE